jgi:hypothetical protein
MTAARSHWCICPSKHRRFCVCLVLLSIAPSCVVNFTEKNLVTQIFTICLYILRLNLLAWVNTEQGACCDWAIASFSFTRLASEPCWTGSESLEPLQPSSPDYQPSSGDLTGTSQSIHAVSLHEQYLLPQPAKYFFQITDRFFCRLGGRDFDCLKFTLIPKSEADLDDSLHNKHEQNR